MAIVLIRRPLPSLTFDGRHGGIAYGLWPWPFAVDSKSFSAVLAPTARGVCSGGGVGVRVAAVAVWAGHERQIKQQIISVFGCSLDN